MAFGLTFTYETQRHKRNQWEYGANQWHRSPIRHHCHQKYQKQAQTDRQTGSRHHRSTNRWFTVDCKIIYIFIIHNNINCSIWIANDLLLRRDNHIGNLIYWTYLTSPRYRLFGASVMPTPIPSNVKATKIMTIDDPIENRPYAMMWARLPKYMVILRPNGSDNNVDNRLPTGWAINMMLPGAFNEFQKISCKYIQLNVRTCEAISWHAWCTYLATMLANRSPVHIHLHSYRHSFRSMRRSQSMVWPLSGHSLIFAGYLPCWPAPAWVEIKAVI